jgi:4-amino-4-deoxy-L-arabinose transferase-like glycosyltransferase
MPQRMANKAPVSIPERVRQPSLIGRAVSETKTVSKFSPTPFWEKWSVLASSVVLTIVTLGCLLPFSGRAFHVDDALFVWAGQQIVKHPLDPYGFQVHWDVGFKRMADVTQNPPLACYYSAGIGSILGWSERALHLAYALPAIAVVIGTFRLARRFCKLPLTAGIITVLTPAFLLCASSVMCDTLMLAFWVWASVLWLDGLEKKRDRLLAVAALLIAAAALTKYFGASLIPLLFAYSLLKERRLGHWALYFAAPLAILAGYELWTADLYGNGLISSAAQYASKMRTDEAESILERTWLTLSFAGGSMLPALVFAPLLWGRRAIVFGSLFALISGITIGSLSFGEYPSLHAHWFLVSIELSLFIMGGISLVGFVAKDLRKRTDPDSWFLALWIVGTLTFAGFLNWTTNVRSVLPLVPAAAILIARKLDLTKFGSDNKLSIRMLVAIFAMAIPALWITAADSALANAGKQAALLIRQRVPTTANLWFEGHWGFQYYMERFGAHPIDLDHPHFSSGDYLAIPRNNYSVQQIDPGSVPDDSVIEVKFPWHATTILKRLGAGCYSSIFGPLPFAFGPVPPEQYILVSVLERR